MTAWDTANTTSDIAGVQMPNVVLWIIALATITVALHTLWTKVVKPLLRLARTVHATYEKVMEYDGRINEVEENTRQLTRNSGSHLADAVYRIEQAQVRSANEVADHLSWAGEESNRLRANDERLQQEIGDVWKTLAARDTVKAALKTAEIIDAQDQDKDDKG